MSVIAILTFAISFYAGSRYEISSLRAGVSAYVDYARKTLFGDFSYGAVNREKNNVQSKRCV